MTLIAMANQIAELELQKDLKTQELTKLNAEYDGIKYLRGEEDVEKKKENRVNASLLRSEISNINHELRILQHSLEDGKRKYLAIGLWVFFGLLTIAGVVLLAIYKYRLGLFGLTDTHDLMAIINGKSAVMDISLYKELFFLRLAEIVTLSCGIIGSAATSIWRALSE